MGKGWRRGRRRGSSEEEGNVREKDGEGQLGAGRIVGRGRVNGEGKGRGRPVR